MARVWKEVGREIHHVPVMKFSGEINFDEGWYKIDNYHKNNGTYSFALLMELWAGFPGVGDAYRIDTLFYWNYTGNTNNSASYGSRNWNYNGSDSYEKNEPRAYEYCKFKGTFTPPPAGKSFYIISFCSAFDYRSGNGTILNCDNIDYPKLYPWFTTWKESGHTLSYMAEHGYGVEPGSSVSEYDTAMEVYNEAYPKIKGYWISANAALVDNYKKGELELTLSSSGTTIIATIKHIGNSNFYAYQKVGDDGEVYLDGINDVRLELMETNNTSNLIMDTKYDIVANTVKGYQFCGYYKKYDESSGTWVDDIEKGKMLENGKQYRVVASCWEQNDAGGFEHVVKYEDIYTWSTVAWPGGHTDTTATYNYNVRDDHFKDTAYNGEVEYWMSIVNDDWTNTDIGDHRSTTAKNGYGVIIVDGLDMAQRYRFSIGPKYIVDENAHMDAIGTTTEKTWTPTDFTGMDIIMTGTTITMTPSFNVGDSGDVDWKATLGKDTQTGTGEAQAKFQLLSNGVTYTIVFKGLYANAAYVPPEDDDEGDDSGDDSGGGDIDLSGDPDIGWTSG